MSTGLLIGLPFGLVLIILACTCAFIAPQLHVALRVIGVLLFVPVALFCLFGLAASFEPGDFHVVWRAGYALSFLASLAAIGRLLFARAPHRDDGQD